MNKRVLINLVHTSRTKLSFKTHIREITSNLKKQAISSNKKNRFRRDTLIKFYKLCDSANKTEPKQPNWLQPNNQDVFGI